MNGLASISGVGLIMQCKHSVDMPDDIYKKQHHQTSHNRYDRV